MPALGDGALIVSSLIHSNISFVFLEFWKISAALFQGLTVVVKFTRAAVACSCDVDDIDI
jgi:hypothetical protein